MKRKTKKQKKTKKHSMLMQISGNKSQSQLTVPRYISKIFYRND